MATATTDHEEIREWVETHGGQPALVRRIPEVRDGGDLSLEFLVDGQEPELVPISWADFFQRFEDHHLAFLYEEDDPAAAPSPVPTWYLVDRNKDNAAPLL